MTEPQPEARRMSTLQTLREDFVELGICDGDVVMAHSSLSSLGYVLGGPQTVIRALLEAIGPSGTLVMPAFSPAVSDPATWRDPAIHPADVEMARLHVPAFDPAVTPTTLGAIPEAFRTWPGVQRSPHPQVSVCALGPLAERIVHPHRLAWAQGQGSPFDRLYQLDSRLLLIGVDFNRATLLHLAESRVPHGRRKVRHIPDEADGRQWITVPDVGDDLNTYFPKVGQVIRQEDLATVGMVGNAECVLMSARALVDRAETFLSRALKTS